MCLFFRHCYKVLILSFGYFSWHIALTHTHKQSSLKMKTTNSFQQQSQNSVKMLNKIQQFTQLHFNFVNEWLRWKHSCGLAGRLDFCWFEMGFDIKSTLRWWWRNIFKICFISSELESFLSKLLRQIETKDFSWLFLSLYEIFVVVVVEQEKKNIYLARIDASKSSSHEETYQIRLSIAHLMAQWTNKMNERTNDGDDYAT